MANVLYGLGKEKMGLAQLNWVTADVRAVLVDLADYTPNFATDEFLEDIAAGARVATLGASLANKANPLGVHDADDITFPSVTGDESEAVVLFVFVTDDTDSWLLAFIDTATGLPATPDGNNINVLWDSGVNRIFAI